MKTNIVISDYIQGRYNNIKLDKLETELKKVFSTLEKQYTNIPSGIEVKVTMSAKYQNTYIHVSNWGEYQEVGLLEDAVQEALENRGFEYSELDGEDDYFNISFE
jgi:hypothetical protein